ncbi:hypothetical protein PV379_02310 [Streptomyces caniscabiei]|uniref:hypothetical protein n=1 Tax=Streptomyces caniscabiei TaxID=2746961 RepID=UPI0029B39C7E|nr:hypothetical protein [Streptomyces caniscabiei]MDX2776187.1 hypothetical protein [Streptomyces caniscabiei]
MNMADQLAADALAYFTQGEHTLAMYCVDTLQIQCDEGEVSASDCSRLLMELAYEMALQGFNNFAIEPVLCRAASIAAGTLTGQLEILITASRIHVLKGNPFGARKQLDRIKSILPEGVSLATIDEAVAYRFDHCADAIRRAVDAIYSSTTPQVQ